MLKMMWGNRNSPSLLVGMQNGTGTLEQNLVAFYTLTTQSSNHATCYLLKGVENYGHTKGCTQVFIAASFITGKTFKPQRCLVVGECINKLWYIQTMDCYLELKRNENTPILKEHSPFIAHASVYKNVSTTRHSSYFPLQMVSFPPDST